MNFRPEICKYFRIYGIIYIDRKTMIEKESFFTYRRSAIPAAFFRILAPSGLL